MINYDQLIFKKLIAYIVENEMQTATLIAPGSKWLECCVALERYINIDNIYDKDPHLNIDYTIGDPIFDDVEINSDLIVTFHGEKLYPPTRMYSGNHFLIVRNQTAISNCTTFESLDHERTFLNMDIQGPYFIFTGNTNV